MKQAVFSSPVWPRASMRAFSHWCATEFRFSLRCYKLKDKSTGDRLQSVVATEICQPLNNAWVVLDVDNRFIIIDNSQMKAETDNERYRHCRTKKISLSRAINTTVLK